MPQLDPSVFLPQLVWLTITFVVLYVLMVRTALPRIAEVLEARRERITHDLDAAASLKAEADQALAEYEASIAEARAGAQGMLAQAAEERARRASERQAALDERLAAQLREAEARLAEVKTAALGHIEEVAADVARTATARLIGVEPDDEAVAAALAAAKGEA